MQVLKNAGSYIQRPTVFSLAKIFSSSTFRINNLLDCVLVNILLVFYYNLKDIQITCTVYA